MVSAQATDDRRVKVSLSLDRAVLDYLDSYVSGHPPLNRSRVVELAIREYWHKQIDAELEAQYAEPESEEIQQELDDWRRIRRAATPRRVARWSV